MPRTEILQHEISYFLKNENGKSLENISLHDGDIEHIEEMIKEGFNQGELCSLQWLNPLSDKPQECRGWWNIKKS